MAYSFQLPVISPTAGEGNDGSIIGRVLETLPSKIFTDVILAGTVYVYRKDITATGFSFVDVSTVAGNDDTSDFRPFGTNAEMTSGDELWVSCNRDIKELYFKIDTPAVWTGTMEIKYSNNSSTANATIQGLVDGTNGFRNAAGVYRVSFTLPTDITSFSPVPGDITARKWLVFKVTASAITTAPILSRVWIRHVDSEVTYLDISPVAPDDLTVSPNSVSFFPLVDSNVYYVFTNKAFGMERYVFQKMADVRTRIVEYFASDNTWKTLTGWTDASNDFKNGPTISTTPPTKYAVRWTVPSDWESKTLNLGANYTGFWIKERTTTITTLGPTNNPRARTRVRQFGDANTEGVKVFTTVVLRSVTIDEPLSVTGTGEITLQLFNFITGVSAPIIIPASPTYPLNIDVSDLNLAVNDKFGVFYTSGTKTLTSVPFIVHI